MSPVRAAFAVALAALTLSTLAPVPAAAGPFAWQPGRNDVVVPMADGTQIDATLWVPLGTPADARLAAIVIIHGYGGSKDTGSAREAADHGYVGFAYSTRGFGKSTGQMDVAGPRSLQDLKDLVAWLKANGPVDAARVGVTGASYGGGHSVQIATHPDVGVATVVPIVPWTDLSRALRPNHVLKLSYTAGFYATGMGLVQDGDQPADLEVAGQDLGRRQLYDTYDPTVHVGFASLLSGVGDDTTEQFLRERSAALRLENIGIPIFLVQGLNDDLFPGDQALPFFQLVPTPEKKLYLGFIGHPRAVAEGPEVEYVRGLVFAWFDHYLKGEGPRPFDAAAPIEVARTPWTGRTENVSAWAGGETGAAFALNADGSLGAPGAPGLGAVANTYAAGIPDDGALTTVEPGFGDAPGSTPADTLVFRSTPLAAPVELLGTPRAELLVRSSGASFQVAVKVFDAGEDGATLVTRAVYGLPDNLPGVQERLIFDLQPYRYTFAAGHRIEVRVAASDFPAYLPEKNPFTTAVDLGAGGSFVRLPLQAVAP